MFFAFKKIAEFIPDLFELSAFQKGNSMGLECTLWQITPEKLMEYRSSDEAVEDFIDFCFR